MSSGENITIQVYERAEQGSSPALHTSTNDNDKYFNMSAHIKADAAVEEGIRSNNIVESTIPTVYIKNILNSVLIITDNSASESDKKTKTIEIRSPMEILVYDKKSGFYTAGRGDIIRAIGIHFDSGKSFAIPNYKFYQFDLLTFNDQAANGFIRDRFLTYYLTKFTIPRIASCFPHSGTPHKIPRIFDTVPISANKPPLDIINDILGHLIAREDYFKSTRRPVSEFISKMAINHVRSSNIQLDIFSSTNSNMITKNRNIYKIINEMTGLTMVGKNAELVNGILFNVVNFNNFLDVIIDDSREISPQITYDSILGTSTKKYELLKMYEAWKNNISINQYGLVYGDITDIEKNSVDLIFEREQNHARAVAENKCQHISLLNLVMKGNMKAWPDLKKFMKIEKMPYFDSKKVLTIPKYDSMIECNVCHMSIICPHQLIEFEEYFKTDPETETEFLVNHFASTSTPENQKYLCRLCGETLEDIIVLGIDWDYKKLTSSSLETTDQTTPIKRSIKSEVLRTIQENITISKVRINVNAMVDSIVNVIQPYISKYEIKLSSVRSNTNDIIQYSISIITAIYSMMFLVHLISSTPTGITFKNAKIVKKKTKKGSIQNLFNIAYKNVHSQKEIQIRKVPAFTTSRLKKIMVQAYRQLSNLVVDISKTKAVEKSETYSDLDILRDSGYKFIAFGLSLHSASTGKKLIPSGEISKILNVQSISELVKLKNPYERISIPKKITSKKKLSTVDMDILQYYWVSYTTLAKSIINTVPTTQKEHDDLMTIRKAAIPSKTPPTIFKSEIVPIKSIGDIDLGKIYGEDGHIHKYDIYTFKNDKNQIISASKFTAGSIANSAFESIKCSICGKEYGESKVPLLPEVLNKMRQKNMFFTYYEYRCPMGYMHVFKEGQCAKCNINKSIIKNKDPDYYKLYIKKYENRKVGKKTKSLSTIKKINVPNVKKIIVKKRQPWIITIADIKLFAMHAGIPFNVLINISMSSNISFSEIVKERSNPSAFSSDDQFRSQAHAILTYITDIISTLILFSSCDNHAILPPSMRNICNDHPEDAQTIKIPNMSKFWSDNKTMKRMDPKKYSNWLLNFLCKSLVDLSDTEVGKKVLVAIGQYIMESEDAMSMPEYFKSKVAIVNDTVTVSEYTPPKIEGDDIETTEQQLSLDDIYSDFSLGDLDMDLEASTGIDNG